MKFLKNGKGFTLVEMLIVMAVVVILAAAALPKVGDILEGARESNDLSVIREAYTEAYTKAAMDAADENFDTKDYTVESLKFQQTTKGWSFLKPTVAGVQINSGATKSGDFNPDTTATSIKFQFAGSSLADIHLVKVTSGT